MRTFCQNLIVLHKLETVSGQKTINKIKHVCQHFLYAKPRKQYFCGKIEGVSLCLLTYTVVTIAKKDWSHPSNKYIIVLKVILANLLRYVVLITWIWILCRHWFRFSLQLKSGQNRLTRFWSPGDDISHNQDRSGIRTPNYEHVHIKDFHNDFFHTIYILSTDRLVNTSVMFYTCPKLKLTNYMQHYLLSEEL